MVTQDNKVLLQQDEADPESFGNFTKQFGEIFGTSFDAWKRLAKYSELDNGYLSVWTDEEIYGIRAECSADHPFYVVTNIKTADIGSEVKESTKEKSGSTNDWVRGYACAVAMLLKKNGINDTYTDELFREGIGTIQTAIDAGVDESDIEEFKKYYK